MEQKTQEELQAFASSFTYDYEDQEIKVLLRHNLLKYLEEFLQTIGKGLQDITRVRNRKIETQTWFTLEDVKDLLDQEYHFVTSPEEYLWACSKFHSKNYLLDKDTSSYSRDDELPIISPDIIFEFEDGFIDFDIESRFDHDGGHVRLKLRHTLLSKTTGK